jgi:hypothetical protein
VSWITKNVEICLARSTPVRSTVRSNVSFSMSVAACDVDRAGSTSVQSCTFGPVTDSSDADGSLTRKSARRAVNPLAGLVIPASVVDWVRVVETPREQQRRCLRSPSPVCCDRRRPASAPPSDEGPTELHTRA